jgi:hypothetical protein
MAQQATIPLAKPIEEKYSPIETVSGAATGLVGVLAGGSSQAVGSNVPKVYIPAGLSGTLCLTIVSQDGAYSATAEYAINQSVSRIYALTFQSKIGRFKSFPMNQLVALAELKSNCTSAPLAVESILPVFWSDTSSIFPIRLLLQVDQGDVQLFGSGSNPPSVQCSEIRSGPKVVFDEECLIPEGWKQFMKDPVQIDINNFGHHQHPASIFLPVP